MQALLVRWHEVGKCCPLPAVRVSMRMTRQSVGPVGAHEDVAECWQSESGAEECTWPRCWEARQRLLQLIGSSVISVDGEAACTRCTSGNGCMRGRQAGQGLLGGLVAGRFRY